MQKKPGNVVNIDDALDEVQIHEIVEEDEHTAVNLVGWYGVSTPDEGIIAYFFDEADACSFRLRIIDRWLNG